MSRLLNIILLLIAVVFTGCKGKFNKIDWEAKGDPGFPDKDYMVDDLLTNYKLKGLSYKQVLQLLGQPSGKDSTGIFYETLLEYSGIDPGHGKNLVIEFNKDSLVTKAYIDEWKH
jgi:hypothetical protein